MTRTDMDAAIIVAWLETKGSMAMTMRAIYIAGMRATIDIANSLVSDIQRTADELSKP